MHCDTMNMNIHVALNETLGMRVSVLAIGLSNKSEFIPSWT